MFCSPVSAAYISLSHLQGEKSDVFNSHLAGEPAGKKETLCAGIIYIIEDYFIQDYCQHNLEPSASICLSHSANLLQNSNSSNKESQRFKCLSFSAPTTPSTDTQS
jgi:hypothetical protein